MSVKKGGGGGEGVNPCPQLILNLLLKGEKDAEISET